MRHKKFKILVGDFETTVFTGQSFTEVWASAVVELHTEDVHIFHSIDETFDYLKSLNTNIIIYYHNLKFDGSFWLSFLIKTAGFAQAAIHENGKIEKTKFEKTTGMKNNTFRYSISEMGQWYSITIKVNGYLIEIRDSLKLLPFSVKKIGKSFGTKHKKLDMEYKGVRYAGCTITDEEKAYIANDVLVVKEALEIMYNDGHNKLTIGSCCLSEYKKSVGKTAFNEFFPNIYEFTISPKVYNYNNAGEYVRKSYKGGWCYLVKEKANRIYARGTTADVNSLYPSMMHSESGNRFPVGYPVFWSGNYIPNAAKDENCYYFVRIRTRFMLKDGYLPFIQTKGNRLYEPNEALITSDVYNPATNTFSRYYTDIDGKLHDSFVTLTLTMTDWILMNEHYDLINCEILDGCYFRSEIGIFDTYIDKYKKIKMESKGAKREEAKLFLNNLYGKMASNTNSSFKYAYIKDDGALGFITIEENEKIPGYIPVGSAITSYARNFTIRAAQKNYHGPDKPGFIYADTDSIHCDLKPDELIDIPVHPTDFCHWKLETCWDQGLFVRQKTYIEHVVAEDLEPIDNPYYNIKCAGMPEKCKKLFEMSMSGRVPENEDLTDEELEFISTKRELSDFKIGLVIPGKLVAKQISGGVLLSDTSYEMRM